MTDQTQTPEQQAAAARSELHDVLGQLARAQAERDEARRSMVNRAFSEPKPGNIYHARVGGNGLTGEVLKYAVFCLYDAAHVWWGPEVAVHLYGSRPSDAKRPRKM